MTASGIPNVIHVNRSDDAWVKPTSGTGVNARMQPTADGVEDSSGTDPAILLSNTFVTPDSKYVGICMMYVRIVFQQSFFYIICFRILVNKTFLIQING